MHGRRVKLNDQLKSQIYTYCQMIKAGKPTAMIPVQERYIDESIEKVKELKLKTYIEDLSEGWKVLWIYKDEYLLEIIKKMPEHPKTAYDHWVLGKIFGYSDESIKQFVNTTLYGNQYDCN